LVKGRNFFNSSRFLADLTQHQTEMNTSTGISRLIPRRTDFEHNTSAIHLEKPRPMALELRPFFSSQKVPAKVFQNVFLFSHQMFILVENVLIEKGALQKFCKAPFLLLFPMARASYLASTLPMAPLMAMA
jgi:hypothetical protein